MKLIRCYIENFGKLHKFELHFDSGLTILHEKNGFGKTTLAAFIKAMFYGFPKSYKSIEKNERKRYSPWQGGIYGGFIEFEQNNKTYRVERTFGLTPKQDLFKLYSLSPLSYSNDFTDNIGYELFGVSESTFEKLYYLPQNSLSSEITTPELKALFVNQIESVADIGDYTNAIEKLKLQRAKLLPYRGKGGLIEKINAEIYKIEREIISANNAQDKLHDLQIALKETEEELSESNARLMEFSRTHIHNDEIQDIIALRKELQEIQENYPNGIPINEEIHILSNYIYHHDKLCPITSSENEELTRLDTYFDSNNITQEKIDRYKKITEEIDKESIELETISQKLRNIVHPKFHFPILFIVASIVSTVFTSYHLNTSPNLYISYVVIFLSSVIAAISLIQLVGHILSICKIRKLEFTLHDKQRYLNKLQEDLELLVTEFGIDGFSIDSIINKYNRYQYLVNKMQNAVPARSYSTLVSSTMKICEKYKLHSSILNPELLQNISQDRKTAEKLEIQIETLGKRINSHRSNSIDLADTELNEVLLTDRISILQAQMIDYHKKIAVLQNVCDNVVDLEHQLQICYNERDHLIAQLNAIDKTILYLDEAYQSLSMQYSQPIKDRLMHYWNYCKNKVTNHVYIDSDMNITIEKDGILRELIYLSAGELDWLAFCIRLAMIDVLYQENSSFLVMDDPFVHLDESQLSYALSILEEVSKSHQILYVTCHENRI